MAEEVKLIKAGIRIIDGLGRGPLKNKVIVVKEKAIKRIGDEGGYSGKKPSRTIDLSDCTVLPSLINCHLHTSFSGEPDYYDIVVKQSTPYQALTSLSNVMSHPNAGFTTTGIMGEKSHLDIALKKSINEGIVTGPRIVAAGQSITGTGEGTRVYGLPLKSNTQKGSAE